MQSSDRVIGRQWMNMSAKKFDVMQINSIKVPCMQSLRTTLDNLPKGYRAVVECVKAWSIPPAFGDLSKGRFGKS
jgi:hypothetical protein